MRANRLAANRGLRWVTGAFAIFRIAPVRQLLLSLAFLFALTIAVAVPLIGFVAVWLLFPALLVGPHAVARSAAGGTSPGADLLVAGFRDQLPAQLRLGGVFLAVMLAVLAASALADGGRFAQAMIGRSHLELADLQSPDLQRAMLIGAGLQTALLGGLWYAPLLVAWNRVPASKSVFFSVAAVLINWRAFLVYGAAFTLLFAVVLMLALGTAMALGGGAAQANSALFSVVWTLLPVWFGSSYLSFRDVFDGGEAAKSPTIPA